MEIKPVEKFHIQTSDEIKEIVSALADAYDNQSLEEKSEMRNHLKELFIAEHKSDPKFQDNPNAYIRAFFRPKLEYIRMVSGTDMSIAKLRRMLKAETRQR